MNWQLIETPPKQREVAVMAAEQRRALIESADYCKRWLRVQGFSVMRVEQGAIAPRIVVHESPLCKKMDGTISAFERGPKGERRYSFCMRFGCEVRWYQALEGGAA
jgi:hypothetical protein